MTDGRPRPDTTEPGQTVAEADPTGVVMAKDWRRPSYNLAPEDIDTLRQLAVLRYGDNRSAALRACVAVGALVLSDQATWTTQDAAEALARYVRAHSA